MPFPISCWGKAILFTGTITHLATYYNWCANPIAWLDFTSDGHKVNQHIQRLSQYKDELKSRIIWVTDIARHEDKQKYACCAFQDYRKKIYAEVPKALSYIKAYMDRLYKLCEMIFCIEYQYESKACADTDITPTNRVPEHDCLSSPNYVDIPDSPDGQTIRPIGNGRPVWDADDHDNDVPKVGVPKGTIKSRHGFGKGLSWLGIPNDGIFKKAGKKIGHIIGTGSQVISKWEMSGLAQALDDRFAMIDRLDEPYSGVPMDLGGHVLSCAEFIYSGTYCFFYIILRYPLKILSKAILLVGTVTHLATYANWCANPIAWLDYTSDGRKVNNHMKQLAHY
ncbi:unnamed protein product, partial [Oppiella nova]